MTDDHVASQMPRGRKVSLSTERVKNLSSTERRQDIRKLLEAERQPITGNQLSEVFGVTRQIIVADVAILRAQGENIVATPQGYLYAPVAAPQTVRRTIASRHGGDSADIRDELFTIVDQGGVVVDVTVEHPLYGEITGSLQIASRYDVERFLQKLTESHAEPLLVLTEGLHLHTIQAADEETLARIMDMLAAKGYLAG